MFCYLNLQTGLIKFRVILCQQVGRKVRISHFSEQRHVLLAVLQLSTNEGVSYFKTSLELCELKLLLWDDDKINAPESNKH